MWSVPYFRQKKIGRRAHEPGRGSVGRDTGYAQPTAEVLKKLTVALHVTADFLLFEDGERGPDEELRLQFEAVAAMQPQEKELAKALLDAIIVKAQVASTLRRHSAATPAPVAAPSRTAAARAKRQPSKTAA